MEDAIKIWEEGYAKGDNLVGQGKYAECSNLGLANKVRAALYASKHTGSVICCLQYLGRLEEAEKWFKQALQIRPKDKDLSSALQEVQGLNSIKGVRSFCLLCVFWHG